MLENSVYLTLCSDSGLFVPRDLCRIERCLRNSRTKFAFALLSVADSIRASLRDGFLAHPWSASIKFAPGTRLPILGHKSFLRVYNPDGSLRVNYCHMTAARLIAVFAAVKKMSPTRRSCPKLAQEVIDAFVRNQTRTGQNAERAISYFEYDTLYRNRVRHWFQYFLDQFLGGMELRFGPGANLDRLDTFTRDLWVLPPWSRAALPPCWEPYYRTVRDRVYRNYFNSFRVNSRVDRFLKSSSKRIMKFHAVPKSIKSFRGVGKTNAALMACQLMLCSAFYESLPKWLPLDDQSKMASNLLLKFSKVGTIDLEAASDTISWVVLNYLADGHPAMDLINSVRIRRVQIDEYGELDVHAPMMGEGVTFPLMSAYFASLCLAEHSKEEWDDVMVYGDDLQVPRWTQVIAKLRILGHKPNESKSYPPSSSFKESCECHLVQSWSKRDFCDARPRYVPPIAGSVYSIENQIRLLAFVKSLPERTNAFRRYISSKIPYGSDPNGFCYPRPPGVPWDSRRATLVCKTDDNCASSARAALIKALRPKSSEQSYKGAELRSLIDLVRKVPHRIVTKDEFKDVEKGIRKLSEEPDQFLNLKNLSELMSLNIDLSLREFDSIRA